MHGKICGTKGTTSCLKDWKGNEKHSFLNRKENFERHSLNREENFERQLEKEIRSYFQCTGPRFKHHIKCDFKLCVILKGQKAAWLYQQQLGTMVENKHPSARVPGSNLCFNLSIKSWIKNPCHLFKCSFPYFPGDRHRAAGRLSSHWVLAATEDHSPTRGGLQSGQSKSQVNQRENQCISVNHFFFLFRPLFPSLF